MPIYEYDCQQCGDRFEVLVRGRSDAPKECPECGSKGITKAFSAFAVSALSGASKETPFCKECPSTSDQREAGACSGKTCPYQAM